MTAPIESKQNQCVFKIFTLFIENNVRKTKKEKCKKKRGEKKTMSTRLSGQDVKAAPTQNIMFVPLLHGGQ